MALPLASTFRAFRARPRLLVAAAVGVVVAFLVPDLKGSTRLLVGWDAAIGLYIMLAAIMLARANMESMQRRADQEDAGAAVVLILMIAASAASLGAIGAELHGAKEAAGGVQAASLVLAGTTILLSWIFVHLMFALHYAHDFYGGEDDRRGLDFPGTKDPDYWDFLYFSFNLGAAAQTSDVQIEARRMRRFVLAHTVLSFLFNTTILALAINVGASLL